jgi:hypothetical protein
VLVTEDRGLAGASDGGLAGASDGGQRTSWC